MKYKRYWKHRIYSCLNISPNLSIFTGKKRGEHGLHYWFVPLIVHHTRYFVAISSRLLLSSNLLIYMYIIHYLGRMYLLLQHWYEASQTFMNQVFSSVEHIVLPTINARGLIVSWIAVIYFPKKKMYVRNYTTV